MIEIRENVKGDYKGYIYTSSIDEAKNIMEIVNKGLLSQNINFNKIEIKHGCTEYYDKYELYKNIHDDVKSKIYKDEWNKIEKEFDKDNLIYENESEKVYTSTINKYNLTDFLIIKNWFSYANLIGDESYMEIFDFEINTNYLSETQINKIISRKKIN